MFTGDKHRQMSRAGSQLAHGDGSLRIAKVEGFRPALADWSSNGERSAEGFFQGLFVHARGG